LDDVSKAVIKAEEQGKSAQVIDKLKDISDGRDEIMKKDLRKIHCCFYLRMIYFFSKYHISPEYNHLQV
jgi:hypothetical protein